MPDPLPGPRLRQVALVAHDCEKTASALQETFGWPDPFHDPGVGEFGLINAVFPVGDTFVEVVSPVQPDTTAGRYLARRGSDSGYMAIFQMPSLEEARRRADRSGGAGGVEGRPRRHRRHPLASQGHPGGDRVPRLGVADQLVAVGGTGLDRNGARSPGGRHRRHNGRGGRPGRGGPAVGPGSWCSTPRWTVG